jgi:hypothetical protein
MVNHDFISKNGILFHYLEQPWSPYLPKKMAGKKPASIIWDNSDVDGGQETHPTEMAVM